MKVMFQIISVMWMLLAVMYFAVESIDKAIYSLLFCLVCIIMVVNENIERLYKNDKR